ncbi:SIMPL domain-containing protein [Hoyosella altamirensis]|uniref:DUF541 domain-containing protein n=1 Tax=Hoyosella altamirensis TaxID=616997 RepID=A0A839RIF0_9ACTN|nr:SIMPL domain-containing protein [Hoyosella altamirensis]MBB3036008.1 hypothetical protein [Hoyosella altamirensis]
MQQRRWGAMVFTAFMSLLTLPLAACGAGSTADGGGEDSPRGVSVVGSGRVTGQPDTLRATVGVEVERSTVQEALDDANAAAQSVIDAVRGAGVEPEDTQTSTFSITPGYDRPEPGEPPQIRGYVVSNQLEIKIRELDSAGAVLQAATGAAGDDARIHGVQFSLEDNEALLEAARERAFVDARTRAEHYADLADRNLGDIVSISEELSAPPPSVRAQEAQFDGLVPIEPGEVEVEVNVSARWSLG